MTQRRTFEVPYPNATLTPDWDLTEAVHQTYVSLGIPFIDYRWERGHQDRLTPYAQLSQITKFNVDVDALCNEVIPSRMDSPLITPYARASLCISGTHITSQFRKSILHRYAHLEYQLTLMDRKQFSRTTIDF